MQQDEAVSDLPCCVLDEITTVRERIRTGAAAGDWKEAQTRASLIDPVLSALGWEVTDPRLVQQEYRARGKSADYALLRADGKPEVIIEAKALGRRLRVKEIDQTVTYAAILGAPLAALTDGDHWMLYEVFQPVPIEERKQFDIRLSDGPAGAVAQELLALRRSEPLSAYRSEPDPPPSPQGFPAPPPPAPNGSVLTLSEVPLKTRQTKPTALLFPDGSGQPITHWYEVLLRTAEWLGAHRGTRQLRPSREVARRQQVPRRRQRRPCDGKNLQQPQESCRDRFRSRSLGKLGPPAATH